MTRVLIGIFVASLTAVFTASLIYALWSAFAGNDANTPIEIAFHIAVYGTVSVFPIAFVGGLPLYFGFRALGWLNYKTVFLGALTLALYPVVSSWVQSPEQDVDIVFMVVSAVSGLAAAAAFLKFVVVESGAG